MRFSRGKIEEAEVGFEPTNNGFAIRPLSPLGYSAVEVFARLRGDCSGMGDGGKLSGCLELLNTCW